MSSLCFILVQAGVVLITVRFGRPLDTGLMPRANSCTIRASSCFDHSLQYPPPQQPATATRLAVSGFCSSSGALDSLDSIGPKSGSAAKATKSIGSLIRIVTMAFRLVTSRVAAVASTRSLAVAARSTNGAFCGQLFVRPCSRHIMSFFESVLWHLHYFPSSHHSFR